MKFLVATWIQVIFSMIGAAIIAGSDIEGNLSLVLGVLVFVIIPALGAYGTYFKNPIVILTSLVFFIFQSVRTINADSLIPNIRPISISYGFGDFSTGQGFLIDFFAIFMAIFLAWLLKVIVLPHKPKH